MPGGWTFRLPTGAAQQAQWNPDEFSLVGADGLPWPTSVAMDGDRLVLNRVARDPASVQLPLLVPDFGRILVQSCPLPEGGAYRLGLELARGEVGKARTEFAELQLKGLRPSSALTQAMNDACTRLTHAVFTHDEQAELDAVRSALWCGELLTEEFGRRAATARKGRSDKPIRLSCVFDDRFFDLEDPAALRKLFDAVTVPIDWPSLEFDSGERDWQSLERRVDWCLDRGLAVTVGPILDLYALPGWLKGLGDSEAVGMLMIDLVETVVSRLQDRVTSWEVVSGANSEAAFADDDRGAMLLVMKALDAVRVQDPQARLSLTIDRPWADYLSTGLKRTSPIDFLDRLLRVDAPISSLNLEIAVGVDDRPSRRRSTLDFTRLLDRYGDLGPSLSVRFFHPHETSETPTLLGQSGGDRQADWLESHFLAAVSKTFVERVEWGRLHDLPNQARPGCGLFAENREPKRALRRLRAIRKACF